MEQRDCFVDELKKLKESSKEAVENLSAFSPFKTYMHVKRNVEDELLDLLGKANRLKKSQLILVCGGVGDGKSHLIAYLKDKHPDLLINFKLHNDATESFEPHKTSLDTLNDILGPFSDHKLQYGNPTKLILAINLGALNNFIDSKYKDRFQQLISYVKDKEILESTVNKNNFNIDSNFQFINFSDYHMFSLTEQGPRSQYMSQIFNKIASTEDNNTFYDSYKKYCLDCPDKGKCPIKENYEMLLKDGVKSKVIDILIEAIVKKKIIISTRSLLNFIYDLIVNSYLDSMNIQQLLITIKNMSIKNYVDYSLTSNLYQHKDLSNILYAVSELDPANIRDEKLDNLIIQLNITEDISTLFNQYVELDKDSYLGKVLNNYENIVSEFNDIKLVKDKVDLKNKLIKLFIRLYRFIPSDNELNMDDNRYLQYMKDLYFWNKGVISNLSTLYEEIKNAIYKWNGENRNESTNIFVGKNQMKYRMSQRLEIEPHLGNIHYLEDNEMYKFIPNLVLEFLGGNNGLPFIIDIDYSLYNLLKDINLGYRPNKKDKYNFISFIEFISKIMENGSQSKEIIIEDKYGNQMRSYKLIYDKTFDLYKFTEIGRV